MPTTSDGLTSTYTDIDWKNGPNNDKLCIGIKKHVKWNHTKCSDKLAYVCESVSTVSNLSSAAIQSLVSNSVTDVSVSDDHVTGAGLDDAGVSTTPPPPFYSVSRRYSETSNSGVADTEEMAYMRVRCAVRCTMQSACGEFSISGEIACELGSVVASSVAAYVVVD